MKAVTYIVLSALMLTFLARPALAAQTIRCESRGGDYEHCRVRDIEDKHVRLEDRLSNAGCDRGRSWGTDRGGIWVDHGCRAVFKVSGRHEKNSGKAAAAVAAGVALAAVLAAAAASSDKHRDHDNEDWDAPSSVTRSCNREARDWVESRRHGQYARLDRIQQVRHRGDHWRMKAYYELVFENHTRTRLATCEVDDRHRVRHFEFE